jgi:dTDP-glucose pyrophosphorylase
MNQTTSLSPTLVILAAGMGSRYGGLKQIEPIGPGGETLMDYSVYDAIRAGFGKVVFVIRREIEAAFRDRIGSRYEAHTNVRYVFQELDQVPGGFVVPPSRSKPWGTAHAMLAAESEVDEPFSVINADDFYGPNAFPSIAGFLTNPPTGDVLTVAMVGYALTATLSTHGKVARGLCHCGAGGWLEGIEEVLGIEPHGDGARSVTDTGGERLLSSSDVVSMNLWGFPREIFGPLRGEFERFLSDPDNLEKGEFYIPTGLNRMMADGRVRVRVLPGGDVWCGVTYKEDKPAAVELIARLVADGVYPARLWSDV